MDRLPCGAAPASPIAPTLPSRACPTSSGPNGPPIARCCLAASTSSSPPAPRRWRFPAALPWRVDMYVAVKGGETAIAHSLELLADRRRGDREVAELTVQQIDQQLSLAVDRVMTEGSCYDRALAALAIKQARGDLIEAIFLLRAYRTTLARFGESLPIDTSAMVAERRISSTFKDVPGGQVLGPTYDYTHRLLDFSLAAAGERPAAPTAPADRGRNLPRVGDILEREGMLE